MLNFDFKMAILKCFFAIKINLVQCILCGQYILADRFLRNSGYLVEHEILSTLKCQFPSKRNSEKSTNIENCLTLFSMGYFKITTVLGGGGALWPPLVTSLFLKVEGQNLVAWGILMCLLQKWH